MTLGTPAIILLAIFCLLIFALIGAYLTVHWRRRSFRHRSSAVEPPSVPVDDAATKELLYFFSLKPYSHEPPIKNTDGSTPEDQVDVDVIKLKEIINKPSRLLSTIKEDNEEAESMPDVDFSSKPAEDDGNTKTVFSTPCVSPFFTPVGSPLRDRNQ